MNRTVLLLLLVINSVAVAEQRIAISHFATSPHLEGWQNKSFKGETTLVTLENLPVLQAKSDNSASGLFHEKRIDLQRTPYLHWSWRIDKPLGRLNEQSKAGDDYPARIYVVISGGLLFWQTQAINYVWSSNQRAGTEWPNAFTDHAHMIAQRGQEDQLGVWHHERRDIRADVKRLIGSDV
ncbi:MAG: hypothetical protein FD130_936, partial [Halothiobacillaceae bacterium]